MLWGWSLSPHGHCITAAAATATATAFSAAFTALPFITTKPDHRYSH